MAQTTSRRTDLDALRVAVFALLILYHAGMLYVTWDFHVKSRFASDAIEPLMLLSNPWRLALLFLISGAACRFMLAGSGLAAFAKGRAARLFPPLLFGAVVIVPPQAYFEVVTKQSYSGSYLEFWGRYLSFDQSFGLILPTWNHLWFVAYALVYALVLAGVLAALDRLGVDWRRARPPRSLWVWAALPFLALFAFRFSLYPVFEDTHALIDDWYNHARYGLVFALGFLAAPDRALFERLARARLLFSLIAALGYVGYRVAVLRFEARGLEDVTPLWRAAITLPREAFAWGAILALLGWSYALRPKDGPLLRSLSEAVFPYYIVHQTLIILAWAWANGQGLPVWAEVCVVVGVTVAGCALFAELARRSGPLRPLFGLKSAPLWAKPIADAAPEADERRHERVE